MAELDNYLARKAAVLARGRETFAADPQAGVVALSARAHVAGDSGVRPTTMGDYRIVSDSAPALAGYALGPSSPQLLLGALASCLVHTYLLQAALRGVALDGVEVEVSGELDMGPVVGNPSDEPIALNALGYRATLASPAPEAEQQALHDAVERTCAVLNTLKLPQSVRRLT